MTLGNTIKKRDAHDEKSKGVHLVNEGGLTRSPFLRFLAEPLQTTTDHH